MPRRAAIVLLVCTPAFTGCTAQTNSAKEFSGEQSLVADVVEQLEKAGERGEPDTICSDILSAGLREKVTAGENSCEKEIDYALDDADAFELDVKAVTVTGTTATARVAGKEGDGEILRTLELVKEGTRWRVSAFGGG